MGYVVRRREVWRVFSSPLRQLEVTDISTPYYISNMSPRRALTSPLWDIFLPFSSYLSLECSNFFLLYMSFLLLPPCLGIIGGQWDVISIISQFAIYLKGSYVYFDTCGVHSCIFLCQKPWISKSGRSFWKIGGFRKPAFETSMALFSLDLCVGAT